MLLFDSYTEAGLTNNIMYITRYRKWFIGFSALMVLLSIIVIAVRGLDYGTEFTGGSVLEVSYTEKPEVEAVRAAVAEAGLEGALVQPFGEQGVCYKNKKPFRRRTKVTYKRNNNWRKCSNRRTI